jgi:hypothetical protein
MYGQAGKEVDMVARTRIIDGSDRTTVQRVRSST